MKTEVKMSEASKKWFETKANRKAERKLREEKKELAALYQKYEPRPFPLWEDPGVSPSDKPFMTMPQMTRFQVLKLQYEYMPLREQGLTHDEAEQKVFPDAYQYRLDREAAAKAQQEAQAAASGELIAEVEGGVASEQVAA